MSEVGDEARYLGHADRALGPSDMEGCGLPNEGRVWMPLGGSEARWLMLGFSRPCYATGVAVYEAQSYGGVRELLLLDEDGEYHVVLDQSQGDRDDADCVKTPLILTFPPTQRRITGLWLRVGLTGGRGTRAGGATDDDEEDGGGAAPPTLEDPDDLTDDLP